MTKIFGIFSGASVVREDIDKSVRVLIPLGVTTDQRNRDEIERKRYAMGERYLCHEANRVKRLDGRDFRPAA